MNARIITALLALLGFGAACSGVKETAKSTDSRADSVRVQRPIRLMYGVRPPVPVEEVERQQAIREKTARKEVKKAQRAREKEAPASKNE